MEPNESAGLPEDGMNSDELNAPLDEEKQVPPNLHSGQIVDNASGVGVLIDGMGALANGASAMADGAEIVGGVASGAGDLLSGAGELISGGADAAGSLIEGAGGCLDGCGSCSLVLLVAFFLMTGTVLAVFR